MKRFYRAALTAVIATALGVGVASAANQDDNSTVSSNSEAKIKDALAKLSDGDRSLAESQRFCVVMETNRLGSMGTPVKLMVAGKPVFLCCKACEEKALAKPQETLAKTEALKKRTLAFSKLSNADRLAAETQRFCAVMDANPLGSMGTPVKVMLEGKAVYLCCKGCTQRALADPKSTLAKAEKLKKPVAGSTQK